MRMVRTCAVLSWLAHVVSVPSQAATSCVDSESTLQSALFAAGTNNEADDIRLQSGTYALSSPLLYTPSDTAITTISGGWNIGCVSRGGEPTATVLDGGAANRILGFNSGNMPAGLTLQGLTFRNGHATQHGGCLFVNTTGSLTLDHARMEQCVADVYGGGLWVQRAGTITIKDSTFSADKGVTGVAMAVQDLTGELNVERTVFTSNETTAPVDGSAGATGISAGNFSGIVGVNAVRIRDSLFENGNGRAVDLNANVVEFTGSRFRNNTDRTGNSTLAQECGYVQTHSVYPPGGPLIAGRITIITSTFQGSGAANSQCFSLNSSGTSNPDFPSTVDIRSSLFSGFRFGVIGNPAGAGGFAAERCDLVGNAFLDNSGLTALSPACGVLNVRHNRFLRNQVLTQPYQGALRIKDALTALLLDNNLFVENFGGTQNSGVNGGAISIDLRNSGPGYPSPTAVLHIVNNTFVANQCSGYGGALAIASAYDAGPTIELWNNLFWTNVAGGAKGSDIFFDNDYDQNFSVTPITMNNDAYLRTLAGYYARIAIAPLGAGNRDAADPQFIGPNSGNYRLSNTSPFIDLGSNSAPELALLDLGGLPRVDGSSVDIGAYETNSDLLFRDGFEVTF